MSDTEDNVLEYTRNQNLLLFAKFSRKLNKSVANTKLRMLQRLSDLNKSVGRDRSLEQFLVDHAKECRTETQAIENKFKKLLSVPSNEPKPKFQVREI